jgi:hypothetical protein
MTIKNLSAFPTSDIEYTIESGEPTTVYRLPITPYLPTKYSIDVTNVFGGYYR